MVIVHLLVTTFSWRKAAAGWLLVLGTQLLSFLYCHTKRYAGNPSTSMLSFSVEYSYQYLSYFDVKSFNFILINRTLHANSTINQEIINSNNYEISS